jgi:hypothetical protein
VPQRPIPEEVPDEVHQRPIPEEVPDDVHQRSIPGDVPDYVLDRHRIQVGDLKEKDNFVPFLAITIWRKQECSQIKILINLKRLTNN